MAHGPAAIANVRVENPERYLRVIASILPRELEVSQGPSDADIEAAIAQVKELLAAPVEQPLLNTIMDENELRQKQLQAALEELIEERERRRIAWRRRVDEGFVWKPTGEPRYPRGIGPKAEAPPKPSEPAPPPLPREWKYVLPPFIWWRRYIMP